jgi:hypothetical protein
MQVCHPERASAEIWLPPSGWRFGVMCGHGHESVEVFLVGREGAPEEGVTGSGAESERITQTTRSDGEPLRPEPYRHGRMNFWEQGRHFSHRATVASIESTA